MHIKVNFLMFYWKIHNRNCLDWVKTSMVSVYFYMRFLALLIHGSPVGRKETLECKILPKGSFVLPICFFGVSFSPCAVLQYTQTLRVLHSDRVMIIIHLFEVKLRWWADNKILCENYNKLKHLMQLFLTHFNDKYPSFLYWGYFL